MSTSIPTLADLVASPEALDKAAHEFADSYAEQYGVLDPDTSQGWITTLLEMLDGVGTDRG